MLRGALHPQILHVPAWGTIARAQATRLQERARSIAYRIPRDTEDALAEATPQIGVGIRELFGRRGCTFLFAPLRDDRDPLLDGHGRLIRLDGVRHVTHGVQGLSQGLMRWLRHRPQSLGDAGTPRLA